MKKGFSILELLIVVAVTGIVATAVFSAFKFFGTTTKENYVRTQLLKDAQTSLSYMTKDIGYAIMIDQTCLPNLTLASGFTFANTNESICIRIPAVDSSYNPVLDVGSSPPAYLNKPANSRVDVGYFSDFIYFWRDSTIINGKPTNQIKKMMIVNTQGSDYFGDPASGQEPENPYVSARASESELIYVVADNVTSLTFSDYSTSTIRTIQNIIDLYTSDPAELNETIEEISKLGISATFEKLGPKMVGSSQNVIKTLKTQVYALRNNPESSD